MFETMGYFLLGLFLLLLGGDSVVRGTSGLAQRLGLSPFQAGLLLLSFATSLPQLAVNAYAMRHGQVDLALGNAVGSNIANIGLTLALAAVAAPLLVRMRLLAGEVVFLLVATGVVLMASMDGEISRLEGGLLLLGFAASMAHVVTRGRAESADVQKELAEFAHTGTGLVQNLLRLVIGGAVLFFGSKYVVASAPAIGLALGFGRLLTGLTVVAVGTALPQLVTALLAARQGQGNVVAGQVLGASLFNLLFMVGGMAAIQPLAVPASLVVFGLPAAMAFAFVLYPILGGDLRLGRRGGGILAALFLVWIALVLPQAWG